jgi:hypothetical protein
VLEVAALVLAPTLASNAECWMRTAMAAARMAEWIVLTISATAPMTKGDEFNQKLSGGACTASRQRLACSRSWDSPWMLPTPVWRRRRCRVLATGRIRCTTRTPRTVVARRDHLLPRATVSMIMIVAGTSFRGELAVATTLADMGRRSMALGALTLCVGEAARLSSVGRASWLAAGR